MNRTLIAASLLASISHGCSHVDVASPDPVAPAPAPTPAAVGTESVAKGQDDGPDCNGGAVCEGKDDGPAVGDEPEAVPVERAPARGSAWAPITIVEFADYQCPFCARAEATIRAIEQAHPGDVRVVFEDMPLPFHPNARPMAKAALAAEAQGRFWEMHDRLFALGAAGSRDAIDGVARDLGLDVARFDRDMDDPATAARIDAEIAVAETLQVTGTPTFFVNGHRVIGAQPPAAFEKALAIAKR
jgi:protein-disulfide isomerase